jgi:hypothetical protein
MDAYHVPANRQMCDCAKNTTLDAETRSRAYDVCALCMGTSDEALPSPFGMECSCAGTYDEDEHGNSTTCSLCNTCLLQIGYCNCSALMQCAFCQHRGPFQPTPSMFHEAGTKALQIWEHMDNERAKLPADNVALIAQWEQDFLRSFQGVLELPLWYEAWQKGDPSHMDTTAWVSQEAWKLSWNAKRMSA